MDPTFPQLLYVNAMHIPNQYRRYGEFSQTWEDAHSLKICHFTGTEHHFKMESHGNYKASSSVAHRRDISFQGFKSTHILGNTQDNQPIISLTSPNSNVSKPHLIKNNAN